MTRPTQAVVLVALGLLGWALLKREWVREGVLRERIHAREVTIAALARQAHTVDTAYVRDTMTLTKWRTQYHAVRDSVKVTDTLTVERFVTVADSTIHACSVALETCEHRVQVRDSIIAATNDLLALERKRGRGFRILGIPLSCTAGLSVRGRADLVCGVSVLR